VEKLKGDGLVEITPDPADGRSHLIGLSEKGAALRRLRRGRRDSYLERLIAGASREEQATLGKAARILVRLLEEDA
jgi:DNA-binding MarR family transcriptional regulator